MCTTINDHEDKKKGLTKTVAYSIIFKSNKRLISVLLWLSR